MARVNVGKQLDDRLCSIMDKLFDAMVKVQDACIDGNLADDIESDIVYEVSIGLAPLRTGVLQQIRKESRHDKP